MGHSHNSLENQMLSNNLRSYCIHYAKLEFTKPVDGILLVLLIAALTGFSNAGHAQSHRQNAVWQKIVSCDNGGVTVDVNTLERREIQIVVHNRAAIPRFHKGWFGSCRTGGSPSPLDPCYGDSGELVIKSRTDSGVFSPSEFNWAVSVEHVSSSQNRLEDYIGYRKNGGLSLDRKTSTGVWIDCGSSGEGPCTSREFPADYITYDSWFFPGCSDQ